MLVDNSRLHNALKILAAFELLKHKRQAFCQPFPETRNTLEVCFPVKELSKHFPLIFYEQKLPLRFV